MSDAMTGELLRVPVSVGEVVDKITILRIKHEAIADPAKVANVERELVELERSYADHVGTPGAELEALTGSLEEVNRKLWVIEDDIRDCERARDFGERFIELARSVYVTNDERARLKREINRAAGSALVEEKSYADYRAG